MSIRRKTILGLSAVFCMVAAKTTQAQTFSMDDDLTTGIAAMAITHEAGKVMATNINEGSESPALTEAQQQKVDELRKDAGNALGFILLGGMVLSIGATVALDVGTANYVREMKAQRNKENGSKENKNEGKKDGKENKKSKKHKKKDQPKISQ